MAEDYTEISREELKKKILEREENLTIIDIQSEQDYRKSHLPYAINIRYEHLELLLHQLVRNKYEDLVVYDTQRNSESGEKAARLLAEMGYHGVKLYRGGKADWIESGLPCESDEHYGRVA